MKAKHWIYISVAALIVAFVVGISVYRNYNSVENQSKRMMQGDIAEWYYSGISVTHNSPSEPKSQPEKDELINTLKVRYKLTDDWTLYSDNPYEVSYIDYRSAIIDQSYIFENKVTTEKRVYKSRYYYDLDEAMPIPLEDDIYSVLNDNYQLLGSSRLWYGDFDAYCSTGKQKDIPDSFYNQTHSQ